MASVRRSEQSLLQVLGGRNSPAGVDELEPARFELAKRQAHQSPSRGVKFVSVVAVDEELLDGAPVGADCSHCRTAN